MSSAILRVNEWWNARETSAIEQRLTGELEICRDKIASLTEELDHIRVYSRVQQTEIDAMALVIARNHERVRAETRDLGGRSARLDELGDP